MESTCWSPNHPTLDSKAEPTSDSPLIRNADSNSIMAAATPAEPKGLPVVVLGQWLSSSMVSPTWFRPCDLNGLGNIPSDPEDSIPFQPKRKVKNHSIIIFVYSVKCSISDLGVDYHWVFDGWDQTWKDRWISRQKDNRPSTCLYYMDKLRQSN